MEEILSSLAKQGPLGLALAVLLYLYVKERERVRELADRLYDLGIKMVESNVKVDSSLRDVVKNVDEMRDDLRSNE
jgi:hypothetical protein